MKDNQGGMRINKGESLSIKGKELSVKGLTQGHLPQVNIHVLKVYFRQ